MKSRRSVSRNSYYPSFATRCRQSCGRLLSQLRQVKQVIRQEFAPALDGYESVLSLALNEAEALAWQTGYPQLLFPTLAHEKAVAVRRWAYRQRALGRANPGVAFAA
jgi:hypothetical protein